MNTQMGLDLLDLFHAIGGAPNEQRCIVLTGAGPRAFCAGGDLKERNGMTDQQWQDQHLIFERAIRAIIALPGADHRRGERRRLCRRHGDRAVLRLHLCRRARALRADRGDARHHARRRRHADPAARGGRAPREGDPAHRQAVHRAAGLRVGHGEPHLHGGNAAGRSAGDRRHHRRQRADLDAADQAVGELRAEHGPRQRHDVRDRGV